MKYQKFTSIVLAFSVACIAAGTAQAFGVPGVGGDKSASAQGADLNTVFDTYIASYCGMLEGQANIAAALDLTAQQQALAAEAARLRGESGKKLDAAVAVDKEAQKAIDEKMAQTTELSPEKKELIAKGTAAYAAGTVKLVELVKQIKDIKKPGMTDMGALGKFKAVQTLPGYIKNVATVLPNYSKFTQKMGVPESPEVAAGNKSLGSL